MPVIVNKLGEHRNDGAVKYVVDYMCRSPFAMCSGGRGTICNTVEDVVAGFNLVKHLYDKDNRKQVSHIIIGTERKEGIVIPELLQIAEVASSYLYERGFQCFYVVHNGSYECEDYQHIHFAINTINYIDGKRYYETFTNSSNFKNLLAAHFENVTWTLINDFSKSWEE